MEENIEISKEREIYKKDGLFKKPTKLVLSFLDLIQDEEVLINLKLSPARELFINSVKEKYGQHLVLTTRRIVLIINRGYIFKEFFTYDTITDILLTRKWIITADMPTIMIKTSNTTYEVVFLSSFLYKKKIKGIIDCVKIRNPNISVKVDTQYNDDILSIMKDTLFTKIQLK